VAPSDAVFVGDAVWDIMAAHASGITCVALTCGGAFNPVAAHNASTALHASLLMTSAPRGRMLFGCCHPTVEGAGRRVVGAEEEPGDRQCGVLRTTR
jgi:hypothetical protein